MTTPLCQVADLDATGARSVTLTSGRRVREIVVVRGPDRVIRAYENNCPHLGITLEPRPHRFLDEDGRHLVCSMHGARFTVADGLCVWGPCEGASLPAIAIDVADSVIRLRDPWPAS
ncbi:MAG: Rieske 2Fe-2S domain-containing protein [Hyphomicrobiaceae bacterium]|nr:Rieske 2Fe-2S domain-containing protein [Hyphomicrobiaceae bacterium]